MRLTHETVEEKFESVEVRDLMHKLVVHQKSAAVQSNEDWFYRENVKSFWRFWIPFLVLIAATGAGFDWFSYSVGLMQSAGLEIAVQLSVLALLVAMVWPKRTTN